MFENIEENVTNWEDENELRTYLTKMLDRETFDGTGLIYGMGHAVYTLSRSTLCDSKRICKEAFR